MPHAPLESAKPAGQQCALYPVVHAGDKFLRNGAAGDLVDELIALAGLVGLNFQLDMGILPLAAGLADVTRIRRGLSTDCLFVGNLGPADMASTLNSRKSRSTNDLQMQLAHTCDDGLACFLIRPGFKGGILFGQLLQGQGIFSSPALVFGSIATRMTGSGNSMDSSIS